MNLHRKNFCPLLVAVTLTAAILHVRLRPGAGGPDGRELGCSRINSRPRDSGRARADAGSGGRSGVTVSDRKHRR